jgi:hypothetical protein
MQVPGQLPDKFPCAADYRIIEVLTEFKRAACTQARVRAHLGAVNAIAKSNDEREEVDSARKQSSQLKQL